VSQKFGTGNICSRSAMRGKGWSILGNINGERCLASSFGAWCDNTGILHLPIKGGTKGR